MKYFTIKELSKSTTATRKGIDNTPGKEASENLIKLVDNVLDPLREAYGKPIKVNSGYRSPKLNKVIGGATNSQHMTGEAVDITSLLDTVEENKKIFDLIVALKLPFDLLINEFNYDWVHVSFSSKNRRLVLKASKLNGRTIYTKY